MDQKQQRGVVIAALAKITHQNGLWVVPSQSNPKKTYKVNLGAGTCTCPDFDDTGEKCKHIHAVEIVARRDGGAPIHLGTDEVVLEQKKTYKQDWPAYNRAQTVEKHRFCELLYDLCRTLEREPRKIGRPRTPMADAVFAATYKVYSTVSTRRFMCDLADACKKGYISKPIHYNSVCQFLATEALTPVLKELIRLSSTPLRAVETDFAVDSTGFSTSRFVRWFDEKYGVHRTGHDWVKVHVMSGVKTNVITAVEIRQRSSNDSPLFRPLVQTTKRTFKIDEVSADKAYSSVKNIETVFEAEGTPLIPFKDKSTPAKGGLWEKMLCYYQLNRDEFMARYHKRSNVESTFSMIKAKFRDHVRSRSDVAMKNEVFCKLLCHNIAVLIHSQCELGIEPDFFTQTTVVGRAS
jgi:transposase